MPAAQIIAMNAATINGNNAMIAAVAAHSDRQKENCIIINSERWCKTSFEPDPIAAMALLTCLLVGMVVAMFEAPKHGADNIAARVLCTIFGAFIGGVVWLILLGMFNLLEIIIPG